MAVVHVTGDTFEQEVLKAEGKVLVDFWAGWCGPCQMLGPVIEEYSCSKDALRQIIYRNHESGWSSYAGYGA